MTRRATRDLIDELLRELAQAGTSHLFGVPGGGSNLDVIGAAERHGIQFVLTHMEGAAAIMAGVAGELTGAPGACVATRGPGAASLVNGVAQALLDRQPMVAITDSVAGRDLRRISHQRLDQQSMMAHVSKLSMVVTGASPMEAGFAVLQTIHGRRGPVHVAIDPTYPDELPSVRAETADISPDLSEPDVAPFRVEPGRRPVVIVGVGATAFDAGTRSLVKSLIAKLCESGNVPVLTTYKAVGMAPPEADWNAGMFTGATIEGALLEQADLVIGIGLDPVELIPGPWPYSAPVVLAGGWPIDDSDYFGEALVDERPHLADVLAASLLQPLVARSEWRVGDGRGFRAHACAAIDTARAERTTTPAIEPQDAVHAVARAAPPNALMTVDAGAHMLPVMHLMQPAEPCALLISSGLATMGFAVPAAIGAALSCPGRPVIAMTGDGGLGMALAELETIARLDLPVTVVVFNDAALSLIAAKQSAEGQGGAPAVEYRRTDFAAVAAGLGLDGQRVDDVLGLERAVETATTSGRPTLIDVAVDPANYPLILDAIRGQRRR